MKGDYRVDGRKIGTLRIEPNQIHGQNGDTFPEIVINGQLQLQPLRSNYKDENGIREQYPYTVTEITGDLCLSEKQNIRSTGQRVCRLEADGFGLPHVSHSTEQGIRLTGRLSPYDVKQLNEHRGRSDFHLTIKTSLTLCFDELTDDRVHKFERLRENIVLTIPRSTWADKIYPKLGGPDVFVIEIPRGERSIEDAWKKIEAAEKAYGNLDIQGVYSNCREALKILDRRVKEHLGAKSCNYTLRWKRAYSDAENHASFGLHQDEIKNRANCEQPEHFILTRADMDAVLLRTQSLLKLAEALVQER